MSEQPRGDEIRAHAREGLDALIELAAGSRFVVPQRSTPP